MGTKKQFALLTKVAKDPIELIKRNVAMGKNCEDSIVLLKRIRRDLHRIMQDPSKQIERPHPAFKNFYWYGDGDLEHHLGLFSMLKDAGFSRIDIESVLIDNPPIATKSTDPRTQNAIIGGPREAVHKYLPLTQAALDRVFGSK